MVTLTKAEEKIMTILWDLGKAFGKEIVEQFPDPKPPYNSVSTIVRVLVKKDIVGYNQFGGTHQYFPKISKEEYRKSQMGNLVKKYYNNSMKQVVNFFSESKELDMDEVSEVIEMLEEIKKKKNG